MPNATDNANQITAPYAGWLSMLVVSTAASWQSLALCGPQSPNASPTLGTLQHLSGTGPVATISGTPASDVRDVEVDITTGGAVGTAIFQWKLNGVVQASGVVTAATYVLGGTGLTFAFTAGTYVNTDVYFDAMVYQPLVDLLPNELVPTGCVERYTRFQAITATVGLLFGPTSTSVTGANAPSLTQTGVNVAGVCVQVLPGTYVDYLVTPSTAYVGFIGSASGNLSISPTSKGLK